MKRSKQPSSIRHGPSVRPKPPTVPNTAHSGDRSSPARWSLMVALPLTAAAALSFVLFACGSRTSGTRAGVAGGPAFERTAAWRFMEAQLAFGPRPVGTPAHEKLKDYLAARMRESSSDVQLQQWIDPVIQQPLTNIIARFP